MLANHEERMATLEDTSVKLSRLLAQHEERKGDKMTDSIPYTKSDETLKRFARNYLRDCKNREYRRMAKSGELEGHLQRRADAAREFAANLIRQGEFDQQARQWAIRVHCLASEMD